MDVKAEVQWPTNENLTLILLRWRIGWAPNSIPIYSYIQQEAKLNSFFISGNCSTCFGWYFHPSSGVHTTVSTASGICHTVTAICPYRGRVGTGLSVLWVAYATHSTLRNTAFVTERSLLFIVFLHREYKTLHVGFSSSTLLLYTIWWVEVPPETCRAVYRYK